jgi:protein-disulfide isomerase
MALDRRSFTTAAAAITAAVAAGIYFGWERWGPGAATDTDAGSGDAADIDTPGALGDRVLGAAEAPVTVIEYASMTCPHCASFHTGTFAELKAKYIDTGKVRFIFREYPLDDVALFAAMLARCADESRFYPLIEVLFEQQGVWASAQDPVGELFKIARLAGFTEASFNACRDNEDVARGIRASHERASTEFGVRGTPTIFLDGERMSGISIADFDAAIAAAGD